jgi:diguanylate cyclase (GGDEF)-like protein/PAS domain S-box-containing protein
MQREKTSSATRPLAVQRPQGRGSLFCGVKSWFGSFFGWLVSLFARRQPVAVAASDEVAAAHLTVRFYKEQAEKMRERVNFLENVFESTSDAVIVADKSGTIQMFNNGAVDIFEMEPVMAIGDNLFRLCTECARAGGQNVSQMLIKNQRIKNLRTVFVGLSGKMTPALLTVNFVHDREDEPTAIVAVIKDNSEVERLTYTDPLTGLHNRRYFDRKIEEEFSRMKRGLTGSLSLLFLDVDHFGDFNKTHGHQTGDIVLRKVAEELGMAIRSTDMTARFGGEEFVAILASTDEAGSMILAERVRQRIEAIELVEGEQHLRVTASIGSATAHADENTSAAELIRRANLAMLQAKRNGRNQTFSASRLTESPLLHGPKK